MTLRLALVIEGDAEGARKALDDTSKGIGDLAKTARSASGPTEQTAGAVDHLAAASGEAGPALGRIAVEAPKAATGLVRAGEAAGRAGGGIGRLSGALTAIGAGLVAGALVAGFSAGADQALRFVGAILDRDGEIKEVLEAHDDVVGRIRDKYVAAAKGAHDFGEETIRVLRFRAQQNVPDIEEALASEVSAVFRAGGTRDTFFGEHLQDLGAFAEPVRRLREEARDGRADVQGFREEVADLAAALAEDDSLREWASAVLDATDRAAELEADLAQARNTVAGLQGDTEAAQRALGTLPDAFRDAGQAAADEAKNLATFRRELEALSGTGADSGGGGGESSPGFFERLGLFASGGFFVDRPTLFGFGRGSLGLMGEAGPEAIMPLRRGAAGLGVETQGGGTVPVVRLASGNLGIGAVAHAAGGVIDGRIVRFQSGGVIGQVRAGLQGLGRDMLNGVSFADALSNAALRLSDRLLDLAFNSAFDALVGGGTGGGGVFSNVLGQAFGGFRQHGGPLMPGRWYVAGEAGPEPIWGGGPGAFAVPAGAGAPATVNNFYVSTPNPRAFAEHRGQVARGAARLIARSERHT